MPELLEVVIGNFWLRSSTFERIARMRVLFSAASVLRLMYVLTY